LYCIPNFNELDKQLKLLTKKELANINGVNISKVYSNHKGITINDNIAYVFDALIPNGKNIAVLKHERFAPVPNHIHTFLELNFVYSGTCKQIIDGQEITLLKGQICIIDTETPHEILNTSKEDIIINVLIKKQYFTSAFFSDLSNKGIIFDFLLNAISNKQAHDNYIIFNTEDNYNIFLLFCQILQEEYFPSFCSEELKHAYLKLLMINLVKVFEYTSNYTQKSQREHIISIIKYIEENYHHCTLSSVAEYFNFNPNYLSSMIKNHTGKNFKDLIMIQKLDHSITLLLNSSLPIYEIATICGFSNLTQFYKKFKEKFSNTPSEYRSLYSYNQTDNNYISKI